MNKTKWWITVVMLVGVLAFGSVAQAQTGGGYDLTWNTIDGGGGYTLSGGFWIDTVTAALDHQVYLPLVLK